MIEFNSSLPTIKPGDISYDYVEKALIYMSFVMDEDCPSLAFEIEDDGYVELFPAGDEGLYTAHLIDKPFGKIGLPRGLRNMLIETEADFNDYKNLLFEEYEELEAIIEEAYDSLSVFEDEAVGYSSVEDFDHDLLMMDEDDILD